MRKEIIYYGTLDSFEGNTSNNIHNPCTKAMELKKDRRVIFDAIESNPNYKAKQLETKVLYETDPSKLGDLEFIEWLKIASLEQLEDFASRDYEQHESLWERFSNWCVFSLFS